MVAETTLTPQSSNIASFGWDPETSDLLIEFRGGDTYRYANVPVTVYEGLQRAPSVGKFFFRHVKDVYAYTEA